MEEPPPQSRPGAEANESPAVNAEPAADDATVGAALTASIASHLEGRAAETPLQTAETPAVETPAAPEPAENAGAASDQTSEPDVVADGGGVGRPEWAPPDAVFSQQLWEVQLLLDFLSGNPARRLPDPAGAAADGLPPDWIEAVCRMTWPPSGSAVVQAEQEALLIKVKDYLNALAAPASGASVAFTLLVAHDDGSDDTPRGPKRRLPFRKDGKPKEAPPSGLTQSRGSLACKAYPDLASKSQGFRNGMFWIAIALTAWLTLTCVLSWYLALGNSEIGQLATAQTAVAASEARIVSAQTAQVSPTTGTSSSGQVQDAGAKAMTLPSQPSPEVAYCDQYKLLPPRIGANGQRLLVYYSPTQADICSDLEAKSISLAEAETNIGHWLIFGHHASNNAASAANYATSILSVLGTGVLPVCYGILGAAASVLRLLSRRMRLSLLTPRDLTLSLQQLALGAVIGACIGLFVTPPGTAPPTAAAELFGPVSLSGSALSFIAGFGVDAVFSALEALIARLFNTNAASVK